MFFKIQNTKRIRPCFNNIFLKHDPHPSVRLDHTNQVQNHTLVKLRPWYTREFMGVIEKYFYILHLMRRTAPPFKRPAVLKYHPLPHRR